MITVRSWSDTIVALVSGPPPCAVAVVRLSGPESWDIAAQLVSPWSDQPESHRALLVTTQSGEDALVLPFAEGRGFTGEQAVEFFLHGSAAGIQLFLEQATAAGARPAMPGEFSRRAFMHGRLDLSQAEGIQHIIEAETKAQWRLATRLRAGAVTQQVSRWRQSLLEGIALIDAHVDFSEELGDLDRPALAARLRTLLAEMHQDMGTADLIRTGALVALVGRPNVGKSSLLNALTGMNRAIVTPIAGTTRDTIEVTLDLEGYKITLVDTAGLRTTLDPIEAEGVARSRGSAAGADLRLVLLDLCAPNEDDAALINEMRGLGPTLVVHNKCDLTPTLNGVSCVTGEGLADLRHSLVSALFGEKEAAPIPFVPRHRALVEQAAQAVEQAIAVMGDDASPDDLASVLLREASLLLGSITGEEVSANMVDEIFSRFCLGK